MKKLFFLTLTLFLTHSLSAEMIMPNKITLAVQGQKVIYQHKMQKSQTIYALAKFFQISIKEIKSLNPKIDFNDLKINQKVNIPIKKINIKQAKSELNARTAYVPLFYQVKKKDSLYKISKKYFNQSVNSIKQKNHLHSNDLKVGQELLIGWYAYNSLYRERIIKDVPKLSEENSEPIEENQEVFRTKSKSFTIVDDNDGFVHTSEAPDVNNELSKDPFERMNGMRAGAYLEKPSTYERKVTAIWNKDKKDKTNLYALHSSAKINSYIEIFNPMLNRVILAKVVGNIPPNTYPREVELIVSPKVAKSLGAIDKKFLVKIKYIKNN